MKLVGESSSSSKANDEVSEIAADPINMADTATTPVAPCATRPAQRGIIIGELILEELTPKDVLEGKGKKKVKGASTTLLRDSTPFPIRRARRKAEKKN